MYIKLRNLLPELLTLSLPKEEIQNKCGRVQHCIQGIVARCLTKQQKVNKK